MNASSIETPSQEGSNKAQLRKMNDLIDEAIAILDDLENTLALWKQLWVQIDKDNPGFDPVSDENWQKKQARCWIHGATDLLESNELERWHFEKLPATDMFNSNARECVMSWRKWLELKDMYYEPYNGPQNLNQGLSL